MGRCEGAEGGYGLPGYNQEGTDWSLPTWDGVREVWGGGYGLPGYNQEGTDWSLPTWDGVREGRVGTASQDTTRRGLTGHCRHGKV